VPDLCSFKSAWEAWWVKQRHQQNELDYLTLRKECGEALALHADGKLEFEALRQRAAELASQFQQVLTPTEPLTDSLVFGLMLAIAAEAEG